MTGPDDGLSIPAPPERTTRPLLSGLMRSSAQEMWGLLADGRLAPAPHVDDRTREQMVAVQQYLANTADFLLQSAHVVADMERRGR